MPTADRNPWAPGLLERLSEPPRSVVIVRPRRIGDFICATPAFRALRAALPEARLTLVALPWARELVRRSPTLDDFEPFPGFPGLAEQFFDARACLRFLAELQRRPIDLALQLNGTGANANTFTLLLGARATAGFTADRTWSGRLDAALPHPTGVHEVQRVLALTSFVGAPAQGHALDFPLWPADHAAADALLAGYDAPLLGLHPAATDATKRWPPDRFAAAAVELRRRYGLLPVVLGGPGERPLAERVATAIGAPCLNLAGATSLPVLGAVIARLLALVSNDSGPAHVAYALGTPSVTIFGATDPSEWGPLQPSRHRVLAAPVACRPCGLVECPIGDACLQAVSVADVVEAVVSLLPTPARER